MNSAFSPSRLLLDHAASPIGTFSIVCDERGSLRDIERLIKRELEREVVVGFEPSAHAAPRPVQPPRGGRNPGQPGKPQARKTAQNPGGPQQHRTGSRHR